MAELIENKLTKKSIIQWIITLGVPLLMFLIPTNELFTPEIRLYLIFTVFIILMVAFEFFTILIPAILLPSLYCASGLVSASVAFSSWSNKVIYMIIGAFVLTSVLDNCGLLKRISLFCIRKSGGTFNGIMYGLFFTGCFLALITFCNSYMVMVCLGYGVCQAMKLKKSKEAAALMMAAGVGANTVCLFVYDPSMMTLLQTNARTIIPDFEITWVDQLLYNAPLIFFCLIFIWIMTKVCKTTNFKVTGGKEYFEEEYKKLGSISVKEKKSVVVLALLLIYLLTNPIHHLDISYGFMFLPWLLFLPGVNVGSEEDIKSVKLDMVFFISACLSIGLVGNELGLGTLLSETLRPVLENVGAVGVCYVIIFVGIIANMLMTPFAMVASLAGPVATIASSLNMNLWAPLFSLYHSCYLIFLPHEMPVFLFLFGFGMMSMKDFVKLSTINVLLFLVFFGVVMVPYWTLLGLF